MAVFVVGQTGKRLMPTTERKARVLLESGKAEVFCRNPFTIQLSYKTGGATQHLDMGVDTGSQHIGIAIVHGNKVLHEAEISLRRSMEKRKLMETRKEYRRGRRYRKVRYRHPKWRHHTVRRYLPDGYKKKGTLRHWKKMEANFASSREAGWIPPSLQSKVDHHIRWIRRFLNVLPKGTSLKIEVARFDMARMEDPNIHGEQYQRGPMYDYENLKAYVLARDGYKCQCCKAKAGSRRKDGTIVKMHMHHVDFKSQGASDNPANIASVCDACHTAANHKPGGKLYEWMVKHKKFKQGLRDATFMNILRPRIEGKFPKATFTYGNVTSARRKELLLDKSHANDAVAIALLMTEVEKVSFSSVVEYVQQVRRKKRSMHEATPRKGRKEKNRTAARSPKNTKESGGICLFDKVQMEGAGIGWVTGFASGACYIKDKTGEYVTSSQKYKQVPIGKLHVLHHCGSWVNGLLVPIGNGS